MLLYSVHGSCCKGWGIPKDMPAKFVGPSLQQMRQAVETAFYATMQEREYAPPNPFFKAKYPDSPASRNNI